MSDPLHSMKRRCRSHCAACGSHFTSDRAFDAHRAGDHSTGDRHCLDPDDVDALRVASVGECSVYPPGQPEALLYEHAKDVDRARQRFGGSPLAPSEAEADLGLAA